MCPGLVIKTTRVAFHALGTCLVVKLTWKNLLRMRAIYSTPFCSKAEKTLSGPSDLNVFYGPPNFNDIYWIVIHQSSWVETLLGMSDPLSLPTFLTIESGKCSLSKNSTVSFPDSVYSPFGPIDSPLLDYEDQRQESYEIMLLEECIVSSHITSSTTFSLALFNAILYSVRDCL